MKGQGLRPDIQKQPKQRSLMVQIVVWLLVVFLIFLVISKFIFESVLSTRVYNYFDNHLADSANYTSAILYEYEESLPWLISYWEEHAKEMDIPRKAFSADNNKWKDVLKWYSQNYDFPLKENELEKLSQEQQKEYAELCYLIIAERFDLLNNTYFGMKFICVKEGTDSDYDTVLLLGMDNNSSEPYKLGMRFRSIKYGSEVSIVYEGESPKTSNSSYYVVSNCIYDKGENVIATVAVGHDMKLVDKEIDLNIMVMDILLFVSLIIICIVVILLLRFRFIKPLETVSGAVHEYTETKETSKVADTLGTMISAPKKTEIENLATDIYDMCLKIDKYIEEIKVNTAEKEKTGAELNMAAAIQMSQFPSVTDEFKEMESFDVYATMSPAREVGGDFYDFFLTDDDHLALVIADVSDKGIPAALFMMKSKTLIRSELKGGRNVSDAMEHVNQQLSASNTTSMFVTAWVAVIELSSGIIKSVNAGHERTMLKKAGSCWKEINTVHDLPLACMPQFEYTEQRGILNSGDIIFVYTDGVPDAADPQQERFGRDRLKAALNGCDSEKPEEIIREISECISEFVQGSESTDDITMLCFKLN